MPPHLVFRRTLRQKSVALLTRPAAPRGCFPQVNRTIGALTAQTACFTTRSRALQHQFRTESMQCLLTSGTAIAITPLTLSRRWSSSSSSHGRHSTGGGGAAAGDDGRVPIGEEPEVMEDDMSRVTEYSIHARKILEQQQQQGKPHSAATAGGEGGGPVYPPVPPSAPDLREQIFATTYETTATQQMMKKKMNGVRNEEEEKARKDEELIRMWREMSNNPALSPKQRAAAAAAVAAGTPPSSSSSTSSVPAAAAAADGDNEASASHSSSSRRRPSSPTAPPQPKLSPVTGQPTLPGTTFNDTRPIDPAEPTESKRRRLVYQSQYRGMVEMDLICGHFARCKLDSLTREELIEYDILLKQLDNDLFKWLVMGEEAPAELRDMRCFAALKKFVEDERTELLGHY